MGGPYKFLTFGEEDFFVDLERYIKNGWHIRNKFMANRCGKVILQLDLKKYEH